MRSRCSWTFYCRGFCCGVKNCSMLLIVLFFNVLCQSNSCAPSILLDIVGLWSGGIISGLYVMVRVFSKSFRSTVNQIESRDPDGFDILRCTTVHCVVMEHNEVHLESKFTVGRFSFKPPLDFMLMNHVHAGNKIGGLSLFSHVYWTVVQKWCFTGISDAGPVIGLWFGAVLDAHCKSWDGNLAVLAFLCTIVESWNQNDFWFVKTNSSDPVLFQWKLCEWVVCSKASSLLVILLLLFAMIRLQILSCFHVRCWSLIFNSYSWWH